MQATLTWVREAVWTCDFRQLAETWSFLALVDPPAEAWGQGSKRTRLSSWKLVMLEALVVDANFTVRPRAGGEGKLVHMPSSLSAEALYARVHVLHDLGPALLCLCLREPSNTPPGALEVLRGVCVCVPLRCSKVCVFLCARACPSGAMRDATSKTIQGVPAMYRAGPHYSPTIPSTPAAPSSHPLIPPLSACNYAGVNVDPEDTASWAKDDGLRPWEALVLFLRHAAAFACMHVR